MENIKEIEKIKCPIFRTKNKIVERITQAINHTTNIKQKAVIVQNLLNEVANLLSCRSFSEKKLNVKSASIFLKSEREPLI